MYPKLASSIILMSLLTACGGDSGTTPTPQNTDPVTGLPIDKTPGTPTNLITISENSRIIVKWDAVTTADSYKIAWSTTQGQTQAGTTEEIPTGTEYTHEFLADKKQRLTTGVPYYYSITAVNADGVSVASAEVEGRLKNKPWLMPLLNSISSN